MNLNDTVESHLSVSYLSLHQIPMASVGSSKRANDQPERGHWNMNPCHAPRRGSELGVGQRTAGKCRNL